LQQPEQALLMQAPHKITSLILWYILAAFFFSLPVKSVQAQRNIIRFADHHDVMADSAPRRISSKLCNQWSSYLPDTLHPEFTPTRYVRINIHVIEDTKGEHNFSKAEGLKWVKQLVSDANQQLGHNEKMYLPHGNNTPVLPIPFRFVLSGDPNVPGDEGIYFHRDDSLFCMNKKARGKQLNSVYDARQYKTYGVRKDSVINIFLIEHCPDSIRSPTYKASNDGVGLGPWAKLVGCYYLSNHPPVSESGDTFKFTTWDAAGLLKHELGHCLGLQHTWNQDDGCDDTPKNPGCWNFNQPSGCQDVSNNVMDYNAFKNALSPCQISRVLQNFSADNGTRKFLVPQWCDYDSTKTITISNGENIEWNGSVDLYGDLIVGNNATLTVHCTLSIPPRGRIILYPKAVLILDGCIVTSRCSEPFQGIQIIQKKKSKPVIEMKNGSVVQHALHPL
jgi:hypothetical protein